MSEQKKKSGGPWFAVIVVLLLLGVAVEAVVLVKAKGPRRPQAAIDAIVDAPITYVGTNQAAPIKIELYAPLKLEWHQKTIGLLREYDKQHPGQIYVTLMPMGNAECDKTMGARGFVCAVVLVNGKHEFTLPNGKTVDFQKWPNHGAGSSYNSEDVITVLDNMKGGAKK